MLSPPIVFSDADRPPPRPPAYPGRVLPLRAVFATLLPALAIMLTSLRLYYRWSRRHLGWDDAFAAFAIFCAFFLTAGAWTRSDSPGLSPAIPLAASTAADAAYTGVGPFGQPVHVRIVGYYMLNVAFTCVLWCRLF